MNNDTSLLAVPPAQEFESAGSWLTRIALAQGERTRDVLSLIGMDSFRDIDLASVDPLVVASAKKRGVDLAKLPIANRVIGSLVRGGLNPQRFLLYHRGRTKYRFCPVCVDASGEPSFPIHWRFACWLACPLHDCLMVDHCHQCRAPVTLPQDMLTAGPRRVGVAYLSRCLSCTAKLSSAPAIDIRELGVRAPWSYGVTVFSRGRAVLSALFQDIVYVEHGGPKHPASELLIVDRAGLLPSAATYLRWWERAELSWRRKMILSVADDRHTGVI